MQTTRQERPISLGTILLATTLAVTLAGCGKKPQAPGTTPPPATNTASTPVVEPVLTAWQQGDQAGAISRFLDTDWSTRPLFTPGSTMSLSEEQFVALPTSDREAKSKEMLPHLSELKNLGKAVAQAGRDAAAKKDAVLARKYFTALQQFGEAIDTPDCMLILRLVGRAMKKLGDEEMGKLGQ
jgi:predicted small lipoprotein YifL